jgi:hypothetical protein
MKKMMTNTQILAIFLLLIGVVIAVYALDKVDKPPDKPDNEEE